VFTISRKTYSHRCQCKQMHRNCFRITTALCHLTAVFSKGSPCFFPNPTVSYIPIVSEHSPVNKCILVHLEFRKAFHSKKMFKCEHFVCARRERWDENNCCRRHWDKVRCRRRSSVIYNCDQLARYNTNQGVQRTRRRYSHISSSNQLDVQYIQCMCVIARVIELYSIVQPRPRSASTLTCGLLLVCIRPASPMATSRARCMHVHIFKVRRDVKNATLSVDVYFLAYRDKFHCDPIWNDGDLGFSKSISPQEEEQGEQYEWRYEISSWSKKWLYKSISK